jgi:hypothetical protein
MKQATEALEHASVKQYCKALRLPVIGANFVSLADRLISDLARKGYTARSLSSHESLLRGLIS